MFSSILFPVDLEHEKSWESALEVVKSMARLHSAKVHVVNVVPEVRGMPGSQFFPADFEENLVKKAKANLAAFISEHMADVSDLDAEVEIGKPYRMIVQAAEELGCDLIIMGSHQRGALDLLIGPNADNVVRHAKTSVLVVRD